MMPKNIVETKTKIPVHSRICIKNINIGNAALASTIKNLAVRAESRQWAVGENPEAILTSQKCSLQLSSIAPRGSIANVLYIFLCALRFLKIPGNVYELIR
jgi:hypothetical protein